MREVGKGFGAQGDERGGVWGTGGRAGRGRGGGREARASGKRRCVFFICDDYILLRSRVVSVDPGTLRSRR